ncbi:hypothetical protein IT570_00475 [Candidatus Sumerlaeota bacterium]|nr:hypothetical protein [Candidatus Sumerlaeota bacterium]
MENIGPCARRRIFLPAIFLGVILISGCDREEITVTNIPKGSEKIVAASASAQAAEASPPAASAAVPDVLRIWRLPEGWSEVPSTTPMRLATIRVEGLGGEPVEVAVTSFPGEVGGELANVNRWRSQLELPPVEAKDVDAALRRFSHEGYRGYFLRIEGTKGVMLAGGVYGEQEARMWFVRAVVPPEAAGRIDQPLFDFLQSFGRSEAQP